MRYPVENFTAEEEAVLRPHFTNLDRPGVLPGQPAGDGQGRAVRPLLALSGDAAAPLPGGVRRRRPGRASGPSTASRASAPRASTSASSWATATTRSPRSAAPTSPASGSPTSSPRCSSAAASPPTWSSPPATSPTTSRCRRGGGGYRYYRDESWASPTARRWTSCSRSTRAASSRCRRGRRSAGRAASEPEAAWRRSIRAKALDLLRGLLPAATLSHVGIFASGQAYEQLLLRLMASPLPEARDYGEMILEELDQGDPELRRPGRAPRPRRRVDRLPARAPRGRPSARSPAWGSTARRSATRRRSS